MTKLTKEQLVEVIQGNLDQLKGYMKKDEELPIAAMDNLLMIKKASEMIETMIDTGN